MNGLSPDWKFSPTTKSPRYEKNFPVNGLSPDWKFSPTAKWVRGPSPVHYAIWDCLFNSTTPSGTASKKTRGPETADSFRHRALVKQPEQPDSSRNSRAVVSSEQETGTGSSSSAAIGEEDYEREEMDVVGLDEEEKVSKKNVSKETFLLENKKSSAASKKAALTSKASSRKPAAAAASSKKASLTKASSRKTVQTQYHWAPENRLDCPRAPRTKELHLKEYIRWCKRKTVEVGCAWCRLRKTVWR